MKIIATTAALAALVALPISNARATITTTENATLTTIYGTGNPNTWDQVVTYSGADGNFQLGLNTHINPNTLTQNIDFSINVNPAGTAGVTLASETSYTYVLLASDSATPALVAAIGDNQYGTSSTPNGGGTKEAFALGSIGNTIFQNSEPVADLDIYFGAPTASSYTLEVLGAGDTVLASDTLTLPSAVPEPTTVVAGALLPFPFGLSAVRSWKKNRTA
jgi:hypothetical protein